MTESKSFEDLPPSLNGNELSLSIESSQAKVGSFQESSASALQINVIAAEHSPLKNTGLEQAEEVLTCKPRLEQLSEPNKDLFPLHLNGNTLPGSKQEENLHLDEKEKAYRQGNWVFSEILILLEAKLKEQARYSGCPRRNSVSSDDKWKQVSEYCRSRGVQRTKEQCKVKWDNMMPDFRKIRDYEEQKEAGARSYFELETWERRSKTLPSNMDVEVYQRIASILSNKPSRGLKREAREKRMSDPLTAHQPPLLAIRTSPNGAEGLYGADTEKDREHITSSPTKKRRRRRRPIDRPLPEIVMKPEIRAETLNAQDDSSTEDDLTVMSARPQQGAPVTAHLFAERSMFPLQYTDRSVLAPHQSLRFESKETVPHPYPPLQNGHIHGVAISERVNSTSPMERVEERGPSGHESLNCCRNHDMVSQIEDRKDARHRELMALEREKLAVFKEASATIVNAMTSAIATFSRVAEELLSRHG